MHIPTVSPGLRFGAERVNNPAIGRRNRKDSRPYIRDFSKSFPGGYVGVVMTRPTRSNAGGVTNDYVGFSNEDVMTYRIKNEASATKAARKQGLLQRGERIGLLAMVVKGRKTF